MQYAPVVRCVQVCSKVTAVPHASGMYCTQGIPNFRTRVLYVPQRPSLLPGTPRDFLNTISRFGSRASHSSQKREGDEGPAGPDLQPPIDVGTAWGIDEELWDRSWGNLSGGEAQRIALAVAVGLRTAEVLLLDGAS